MVKMKTLHLNMFRIKEAAAARKTTLTAVCSEMGCTTQTLRNWIRGGISEERAAKLAGILGVSVKDLSETL
jgi:transcriptional regulator with XRE-family HTH domain